MARLGLPIMNVMSARLRTLLSDQDHQHLSTTARDGYSCPKMFCSVGLHSISMASRTIVSGVAGQSGGLVARAYRCFLKDLIA
jgi:hypothetical protein